MTKDSVGVSLRPVHDGDLEVFFAHQADAEASWMADFPSRDHDAFMAHWAKIRSDASVVTRTAVVGGRAAGHFVSWEDEGQRHVGYWIGRDHWGRGVATAGLALFLDEVTARPLHAYAATHNTGSIRVLVKCGFRQTAEDDVAHQGDADGVNFILRD